MASNSGKSARPEADPAHRVLLEICHRAGLLGQLQALDFRELARRDERPVCMGNVYVETRALPVWADNLPMLPVGGRHSGR